MKALRERLADIEPRRTSRPPPTCVKAHEGVLSPSAASWRAWTGASGCASLWPMTPHQAEKALAEAEVVRTLNAHATAAFQVGYFAAGRFFKETPPGSDTTYVATKVTYKF